MVEVMNMSTAIKVDGTTDGGCFDNAPIPANDPSGKCPTGEVPADETAVFVTTGILIVIIIISFLCCIGSIIVGIYLVCKERCPVLFGNGSVPVENAGPPP